MGASGKFFNDLKEIEVENINSLYVSYKPKLNGVIDFIQTIVQDVENGNKDALEVFIAFKTITDNLDKAKKTIDQQAIDEAYKMNVDRYNGYKVTVVEGRKTLNYKGIPEIESKEKELKELQEKYKHAFEGVQKGTVQINGNEWVDSNGELLPLPIPSYGKSYIKIEK